MPEDRALAARDGQADSCAALPAVLAGPILRRVSPHGLTLWLATRAPADVRLELALPGGERRVIELVPDAPGLRHLAAGEHLHYLLIDAAVDNELPRDCWIGYRLLLRLHDARDSGWQDDSAWAPGLRYPGKASPGFVLPSRVRSLLHGSCRKPHHDSDDALVLADRWLAARAGAGEAAGGEQVAWPSFLVMSGDQIYADDVAGPMLVAIHRLVRRLGLPAERLDGLDIPGLADAEALLAHPDCYYRRERLLPRQKRGGPLFDVLFGGARKPVFTADAAHNHLVTLAEVLAMYLLAWSPGR